MKEKVRERGEKKRTRERDCAWMGVCVSACMGICHTFKIGKLLLFLSDTRHNFIEI